ncbi:hypothetical protein FOA52_004731 [Chlamydomonas sp. UWO 241]|nr:hypothetical protein FOA52_004731 [Chlamydomonas sp. UWO 241]
MSQLPHTSVHLPDVAIETIAYYLYGTQLLRARLVDKRWSDILKPLVRTLVVSPREWASNPRARSEALVSTFTGVQVVQVVLDANRNPRNFQPAVIAEALAPLQRCTMLSSLHLTWRTWIVPNEGYSEEHFDSFVDRWTTAASLLCSGFAPALLSIATRLTELNLNVQSST